MTKIISILSILFLMTAANASDTIVIVQAISDESDIISDGSNINIVRSNDGYVRVVSAK